VARLEQLAVLVDETIEDFARTYLEMPEPLKAIDPRILKTALKQVKGNIRRLTAEADGSIIIWNNSVW